MTRQVEPDHSKPESQELLDAVLNCFLLESYYNREGSLVYELTWPRKDWDFNEALKDGVSDDIYRALLERRKQLPGFEFP